MKNPALIDLGVTSSEAPYTEEEREALKSKWSVPFWSRFVTTHPETVGPEIRAPEQLKLLPLLRRALPVIFGSPCDIRLPTPPLITD